jgi:hypothetical protein
MSLSVRGSHQSSIFRRGSVISKDTRVCTEGCEETLPIEPLHPPSCGLILAKYDLHNAVTPFVRDCLI